MGASSSVQRKPSDDQPAEEELVLNELKVETGDQNAVKNMLDDAICEFFEDKPEYTIHYGWDNIKLLLMVLATLAAAASHFVKTPAISERVLIYSTVGAFFFVHVLLLAYSMLVEKDTILRLTKKGAESRVVLVRTDFPYAEENYSIVLQSERVPVREVKVELYVGRFFDQDGYFSKDAFVTDLAAVVARFESAKKTQ